MSARIRMSQLAVATVLLGSFSGFGRESLPPAVQREVRPTGGFEAIRLAAPGDAIIIQGATEQVVIEAEPKVLERMIARVSGGRLHVESLQEFSTRNPVRYIVTVQSIKELHVDSTIDLRLKGLRFNTLRVAFSGAGSMEAARLDGERLLLEVPGVMDARMHAGSVREFQVKITGTADIDARGLEAKSASVDIAGSADVVLAARDRLDVHIGGTGEVRYMGKPSLKVDLKGAGLVQTYSR